MTKNTPRIFISLLLMLLCIGILPVSAFASGGDYPDDALPTAESSAADAQETKQIGTVTTNGGNLNVRTGAGLDNTAFTQLPNGTVVDVIGRDGDWVKILLPARVGYVYGSYLTVTDAVDSTASIGGMTGGSDALTPDGNLTLIDDIGTSTKAGKQFITLESKNGNVFYMIIDRDDEGEETVHFLNQVDEADLMALTGEEETPSVCSCTTKCVAGTVNTSCPVCAVNMTECVGKEAKPEVPAEPTEPAAEEPEKKSRWAAVQRSTSSSRKRPSRRPRAAPIWTIMTTVRMRTNTSLSRMRTNRNRILRRIQTYEIFHQQSAGTPDDAEAESSAGGQPSRRCQGTLLLWLQALRTELRSPLLP